MLKTVVIIAVVVALGIGALYMARLLVPSDPPEPPVQTSPVAPTQASR